ncbi:MAG: hypothetical protein QNJ90_01770 [Planctomycetota bacterium]|nr:hypothetical protein [Planctomycetota bacterium]
MRTVLALCLVVLTAGAVSAEEGDRRPDVPFLGLGPFDAFDPAYRDAAHLERLADLGRVLARTTPIDWGTIEAQPPRSAPPRYDWKTLDEAVLVWQLSGLEPVLVLSPRSGWAGVPVKASAWAQRVRRTLPAAESDAALRTAGGCAPPQPGRWKAWERFVRDVVERYDGDGRADMPGLRGAVRHVQILGRLEPAAWLGSAEDYLRLLHHAGLGAKSAAETTRIVTASVDLAATGHAPHPDRREWDYRIGQLVPADAPLARLEVTRRFEHIRRLLAMPRLYEVLAHAGNAHLADDVANLRFLRRHLDEHAGGDTGIWLVDNPTRKLGGARVPGAVAPKGDEVRLRRRWLPAARNPAHSRHAEAKAWLRRGQAYDFVRGVARARAAGADAVLALAPFDRLPAGHPGGREAGDQGFLAEAANRDAPAAGVRRTPAWWALRQMHRLLGTHRSAGETSIGAPGRSVVFRLPSKRSRPWIALLMLDARLSWAGAPGEPLPVRDVLIPLPSGHYVLESLRLGSEAPKRRRVQVKDGMLRLALTPAPVYVIPADAPAR